ncbi:methylmalonyl-CoA mutase family protein [Sporosarcina koreensis]|uniref:methylmalonyl-CoA mutase family protein n=1 Tax=Sporosarcina koreensis TaxID=334735 RepID=UPI000693A27F|nr:methylmalonyl-CoA mutase family protein [Sporosarcina koreensis]
MGKSDIHTMKQQEFSRPTAEEWRAAAETSLKGRKVETLETETMEGIRLKPLYMERPARLPVRPDNGSWVIAQGAGGQTGQEWLTGVREGLEKGNEAICLDGRQQKIEWDDTSLEQLAELLTESPIAWFHIEEEDEILKVFGKVQETDRKSVSGLLCAGNFRMPAGYPNVRTEGIDLEPIHMKGADSVTELAYALAAAAERAEKSEDFEQFANSVFFRFAADTQFFMEIAKFRAFRSLWSLFSSAYGADDDITIPVCGITSMRSFSKIDPHVNLLRAANSAFSAVLGGADWLMVTPYNALTGDTPQSQRYARSMQLILREETHAGKTADPSGGSYFIEQLTDELIRRAWQRFLDMQEAGGTEGFLASGRLEELADERKTKAAAGELRLIGTNVYADPEGAEQLSLTAISAEDRPAYPFERLRERAKGCRLDIVLIPFGKLADYKPRTDFAAGFLAVAGLTARMAPPCSSGSDAAAWLNSETPDYAILCADPATLESVTADVLARVADSIRLDAAGKAAPALAEQWLRSGLNGFIHAGQDKVMKLTEIISLSKGGITDEKA